MRPRSLLLSLLLLALSGSAAAAAKVLKDLPYGYDAKQRLDVYLPNVAENAPVMFMVHGGAWRYGDKNGEGIVERKVARWLPQGWIFISANYRLVPDADPLVQAQDVARALAFAQSQAASWGGDPAKFVVMGHSAGAHLVSLLAVKPSLAFEQGAKPWLGTVSLDSAAFDVVRIMRSPTHPRLFDRAFGKDESLWLAASPLEQLSSASTPILAVCSTRRRDQPCIQVHDFAQKASTMQIRVEVLEQDLSHSRVNNRLGLDDVYTNDVEFFIASLTEEPLFTLQKRLRVTSD